MNASQMYIVVAIVALAVIALLAFFMRRGEKARGLTPLAGLAFACVVAGIAFGENRVLGYGLMGAGVILSVIDAVAGSRRK
jgi:hypothetical protein